MYNKLFSLLIALILSLSSTITAANMRTDTLVSMCQNEPQALICIGYISGVTDALVLLSAMNKHTLGAKPLVCPPSKGISNEVALKAVLNYITQHPESLRESARVTVMLALAQRYSCSR